MWEEGARWSSRRRHSCDLRGTWIQNQESEGIEGARRMDGMRVCSVLTCPGVRPPICCYVTDQFPETIDNNDFGLILDSDTLHIYLFFMIANAAHAKGSGLLFIKMQIFFIMAKPFW